MRKLIAGMKSSLDQKIEGPEGYADWVEAWSEQTPHYVLSNTLSSAVWPQTTLLRRLDEITALKQQSGKDIYLVGGARTTASLIDAGLVDELRLIVYPLLAGDGKPLFGHTRGRRELVLANADQLEDGRVSLIYEIGP